MNVTLSCASKSFPKPNLTLYLDDKKIHTGPSFTISKLLINLPIGQRAKNISCLAENSLGKNASEKKELTIVVPPDPPMNFQKLPNSSYLCWDYGFNGNSPLLNVTLSCMGKESKAQNVIPVNNTKRECTIPKDLLESFYGCQVSTSNKLFSSLWSNTVIYLHLPGIAY